MTNKEKVTALVAKLREHALALETADANLLDDLTVYDLDKAERQFAANIDRTMTDANRRFTEGLMVRS